MKKLISILIFTGCFFAGIAQDSLKYDLADGYYKKSQKAFDDTNYDSACLFADKHLAVELSFTEPRNEKVVVSYITKAFCEFNQKRYRQSIEVYNMGIKWMGKSGSGSFAKSFFDFINLCYDQMENTDSIYFDYSDKDYRKVFLFRIEEVLWQKGSKFRVRINAGLNDGLILGSVAFPISAPLPDSLPERNFQLGTGEIVSIGPWSAEAEVDIYDSTDTYNWVQEGDIIETRIFSKFKEETVIYDLLSSDVFFKNNSREKMVNPRYIIHYDSKEFKELQLLLIADQIFDTEEFTREGSLFLDSAKSGQNQGLSLHDLFLNPDTSDIEDYLEFVAYFPRKYMGKDYKVNETYATWVINNSPSTPYVILDSLLAEENYDRRLAIMGFNKTDLTSDFYEKWAEKATDFADKQEYELALKTSSSILEAAKFLGDTKIQAHGLYNRGAILKTQNLYEPAITFYDSAAGVYLVLKDTLEHIRSLYKAADVYGDWGRYKKAEEYFDIAIAKLEKKIGNKGKYAENELMAYLLWDKGYNVSQNGDYDAAFKVYTRAEEILNNIGGSKADRATLYRNMAYVIKKKGLYTEALEKYKQSLELYLAVGNQQKYALLHDDIGDTYFKLGQYREAIANYDDAYEIKLTLDDKSGAGFSKSNIGQAYWNLGQFDSAVMSHKQAIALRSQTNDIVGMAYSYEKIAAVWKESGNLDSSIHYYLRAEEFYIANNDTTDKLAELKESMGSLYAEMKHYDLATFYYTRAHDIYKSIHNDLGVANSLYNLGTTYYETASYIKAKNYLSKAYAEYKKADNQEKLMKASIYLSYVAIDGENNYVKAEKLMNEALWFAKISNSLTNQGWAWESLGYLKNSLGKLDAARRYYDSALTAYTSAEYYHGIGSINLRIGRYYIEKGEFAKTREVYWEVINNAIERKDFLQASDAFVDLAHYYNLVGEPDSAKGVASKSLELNKEINNDYIQAGAYLILGNTYNALTQYATAVEYYRKADSVYFEMGDVINQSVAKNNVGTIYFSQGEYANALIQFSEVIKVLNRINYEGDFLISAYLNLGETYIEDGFWAEAERWAKDGLMLAVKQENRRKITAANLLLGHLYLDMKKYAVAKQHLFDSYKDFIEIGEKDRITEANTLIGKLFIATGKPDSARVFLNTAIQLAKQTGNSYFLWEPLYLSSSLNLQSNDTAAAVSNLKESIDVLENIKRNISGRGDKMVSFTKAKDKYKIYQSLVELLVAKNDVKSAFFYQEKANIAGLQSQTRSGDNGPTRSNELLDSEAENTAKELEFKIDGYLAELIKERSKPVDKQSAEKIKTLEGLIDVNETNYNYFVDSAVKTSGGKQINFSSTIKPTDLDDARFSLADNEAVVEYLATENQLLIFVATNNSLNARKVAIKEEELNTAINEFHRQVITSGTDKNIVLANSNKLYQIFIEPIADLIQNHSRLAFVPTGIVYKLPIQALGKMEDGKIHYLITNYEISYINNVKFIYQSQAGGTVKIEKLAAFGNADNTLGNAEKEVNSILSLIPSSSIYVRDKATEDMAKKMLTSFAIIHFATHGRFDPLKFENSYLVMAPNTSEGEDGKLTVNEIRAIQSMRNVKLLVLSACDQAVGEDNAEGWVNSPAFVFLLKGVERVVATQWKVHDEATSMLMVAFYENLIAGMTVSQALSTSQMKLAQSEKFSHPYYWGAFEIMGKW